MILGNQIGIKRKLVKLIANTYCYSLGRSKRAYEVNIKAFEELLEMLDIEKLEKIIYFSTASILDTQTELMRESLIYGTEYIQTKYECFQRLRESSFAEKT